MMDDLLNIKTPVSKVISDGAYYRINREQTLGDKGIIPVIPPTSNALLFMVKMIQCGMIKY